MRVVLDTNVIISRYLSVKGTPAQIIEKWEQEVFTLIISEPILSEYQAVLGYEKLRRLHRLSDEEIDGIINQFRGFAELVEITEAVSAVPKDASDNKFLECALSGNAGFLITGDAHLLELKEYRGVTILDPASFLAFLKVA